MNVAPGPNPAFEMDLPIIAVIDLPLNQSGLYTMRVSLDGDLRAEVRLHVSGTPQVVMPAARGNVQLGDSGGVKEFFAQNGNSRAAR